MGAAERVGSAVSGGSDLVASGGSILVALDTTHRVAVFPGDPGIGRGFRLVKDPPQTKAPARRMIRPSFEE